MKLRLAKLLMYIGIMVGLMFQGVIVTYAADTIVDFEGHGYTNENPISLPVDGLLFSGSVGGAPIFDSAGGFGGSGGIYADYSGGVVNTFYIKRNGDGDFKLKSIYIDDSAHYGSSQYTIKGYLNGSEKETYTVNNPYSPATHTLNWTETIDEVRIIAVGSPYDVPATFDNIVYETMDADVTAPTVSVYSPLDNATGVGVDDNLVLTFNENVVVGTGNIVLKKVSDNSTVETIDVTSGQVTAGGAVGTIIVNPSVTLSGETGYYVEIDATAFDDGSGNSYAGISGNSTWNFTTADITAPTVSIYSPLDNATGVGVDDNLVLTFNENVVVGTGNIVLKKVSDNSTVETIDVTSGQVTAGGAVGTIIVNPSVTLSGETGYYVEIDGTAFDDGSGNSYAGIIGNSTWNFTTADITAPTVSVYSPLDNATGVGVDDNLVLTFNENVVVGTGNIVLKKVSDNSTVETIDVTSGQVTAGGAVGTIIVNPSVTLSGETGYYVEIDGTAFDDGSGNSYAGIIGNSTWNFTTADITAPTVSVYSPLDNATGVGVDDNLVLTFNENVVVGTGNIVLKKVSDNSTVETIDVTSDKVTGGGTSTITVNPGVTLSGETGYYVEIAATAFDDGSGNSYAGIIGNSTWNFTTADITAPTVSVYSPLDNATGVGVDDNLALTFNENVVVGTGNIVLKKVSDNSTVETIDVTSGQVTAGGAVGTIIVNPSVTLSGETGYYVEIDGTAFDDGSGNSYAGIIGNSTWNFTTADITAPTVSVYSPLDNATGVGVDDNLVLTFNENVVVGTGNIVLKKVSDNSTVETIDVTSGQVTAGGAVGTIIVNPSVSLSGETGYYVEIDATAFDDGSGNSYAGISGNSTWNFTTADITAPTVSIYSPLDNATGVGVDDNLVLTFNENVVVGTGNIVLKKVSDNSTVETIDVTSGQVTAGGAVGTIIVNPSVTLSGETGYYVEIDGTAFDDGSGNSYAGIIGNSTWNFTTADITAPTVSVYSPLDNATGVGVDDNLVLTFNENVVVGTGNIVLKKVSDNSTVETIDVTSGQVTAGGAVGTIIVNPSVTLSGETGYYVEIDGTAFDDGSGNSYAGIIGNSTWNFTTADITAPTVSVYSPLDNATGVGVDDNLVLTFNENVVVGTGNIVLKKVSDNSTVETIDVTSDKVTGGGTSTITVNPGVTLSGETGYYVEIAATAFDDGSGNSYAGIIGNSTWNFTTADITAPTVSIYSPLDNATGVGVDDNLVLTFNENIAVGTGNIVLKKVSDNSTVETIDVINDKVTGGGTSTITVNPGVTLSGETGYYVEIAATAFDDSSGNSYAGIIGNSTWNFTTADITAPTVSVYSPLDNATGVGVDDNWVLTFNENIAVGTGNIVLKKVSDNSTVETIDVTSDKVTGGGTSTITVNPGVTLSGETGYYVEIAATAFDDGSGNSYAGIIGNSTWNFTTADITAPTVSIYSPLDNATGVGVDDNLVLTFNENIAVGTGNIVLKKVSDNSTVETIDVINDKVTGGGTSTITVNPGVTLSGETGYYVEIAATAFDDGSGNSYAGIIGNSTWNFTTADITAPTVSIYSPLDNATGVGVDDNLVLTFNENIAVGTGNIVLKKVSDNSTVETIDVINDKVTGGGTSTITVNPSVTLSGETEYYVEIDSTAFDDGSGNSYAGIIGNSTWNFTTMTSGSSDTTAPTVVAFSPMDNASSVGLNDNLVLTFNENVVVDTGMITIKKTSDNSIVESIDVTNGQVTSGSAITIVINPSVTLESATGYYVEIDGTAFADTSSNSYVGISGSGTWNFTTMTSGSSDTTAPTVIAFSPVDNAISVGLNDNLVLTFNENVVVDTGTITIKKTSDNSIVESIDVTNGQVTSGSAITIVINPSVTLESATGYYVEIDGTAFADISGNSYVGISGSGTWNFTTMTSGSLDTTAPTVVAFIPVDNASSVGLNDNLVLTFNENVAVGTGTITIKKTSDNSIVESIDVTSGQVTSGSAITIVINPSVTLESATGYYVEIDGTAFADISGNYYAGVTDNSTWNFTTLVRDSKDSSDKPAPPIENISIEEAVIVVNGGSKKIGETIVNIVDGKKTISLTVDNALIESEMQRIMEVSNEKQENNIVAVSVQADANDNVGVLFKGDLLKRLQDNHFKISVSTGNVDYTIPVEDIKIESMAKSLDVESKELEKIEISIEIIKSSAETIADMKAKANIQNYEIVFEPVEFKVIAKTKDSFGGAKNIEILKFNNYVERVMQIPADIDPSKITTGIVYNSDGTFSHIPTEIFSENGVWYAKLNSLTNSIYSVIWNPITVHSVDFHWSKDAVNEMASRLIIKKPELFEPDKAISRGDFSEYITKALGLYRTDGTFSEQFTDISIRNEYASAIMAAVEYGIVSGYPDGTFRANQTITREEAMVMYSKAMKILKISGKNAQKAYDYTDYIEVSSWAKIDVQNVIASNIFSGTGEMTLSPKSIFTYAEAAQAIQNLLLESKMINN